MAESEIVRAIRRQRAEVARNELDTLRRLVRLWVPSYRYLKKQADALARLIQERREAGEPVEIEYIYSHQRYKAMAEQARKMIRDYSRAAAGQISGAEAEVYELGKQNGRQLITIAEPDDPMWTRVNRREARIMEGMTANGSPLFDLLNKAYSATIKKITEVLTIGISTGQGSKWIAQQLTDAGMIPEQRALVIARTEVNRAYRQSNWEQMQSSRAVKGYRRMCYPETACLACLMLDGEFYPVGTEPCDHPNGKCSFVPVTKHFDPINDPNWKRGPQWFAEQDEETQRKIMGPGRFDLWKNRGVDPKDMVYIKPNDKWGGSPAVRTLESLKFFSIVGLRQEGSDPSIPESIRGDFSDFDPLDITEEVEKSLSELKNLAQQNHFEYGQIFGENTKSNQFTSRKADGIEINLSCVEGNNLKIYHSHTNVTPPSSSDLRWLCNSRVSEIGSIAINGDIFIVRIGDGIRPEKYEFDETDSRIRHEIDSDLMKDLNYWNWTLEEKNYMFIREKVYRLVREFGWQIEGGNINE